MPAETIKAVISFTLKTSDQCRTSSVSPEVLLADARNAGADFLIYTAPVSPPSGKLFLDTASLFHTLSQQEEFALFLESGTLTSAIARYAIIALKPSEVLSAKGRVMRHTIEGRTIRYTGDPLFFLQERLKKKVYAPASDIFTGGFVGYFGYESHRYTMFEAVPLPKEGEKKLPDMYLFSPSVVITHDTRKRETFINITVPASQNGIEKAQEEVNRLLPFLDRTYRMEEAGRPSLTLSEGVKSSFQDGDYSFASLPELRKLHSEESFSEMVRKAREYICAGDIYQVNLSQRFEFPIDEKRDPWHYYTVLRELNPSPFGGYLKLKDISVLSSSPERLIKRMGRNIETRPIAGTRPRGKTELHDKSIEEEFLLNDKERAEHIMMIDLERNDLGKVAETGSVNAKEALFIENYSHVKHLVTNITATSRPGTDWLDTFTALFPGGTITGCPKKRAMEIIAELEGVQRGIYTGSLGWISYNGNMDLNILIRSFLVREGKISFATGAGIVYDSDPEQEYLETLKKAEALMRTLAFRRK